MAKKDEKSKLSLLIMTQDSPNSYSPAGERVRHMALAGSLFFEKVRVLTLSGSENNVGKDSNSNVLLKELRWSRELPYPISALFDPLKTLLFLFSGLTLIMKKKPSHILASMPPVEVGASAWLLAKLAGRKLIVDLRDDWESSMEANVTRYIPLALMKPLFKLAHIIYSSSILIFTATGTIADSVQKRGIQTSVFCVPNGADTSIFFPRDVNVRRELRVRYGLPINKTVIVYCGSAINPYYRLDQVLLSVKALTEVARKAVFFVFYVYNGIDYLQRLKNQLGISDNLVDVRGPIPRDELAEVLAACDIGLLPFDDSLYLLCARSTKLYEYLSSGLYVICSGPKNGELDTFFSLDPKLGFFVAPRAKDFNRAFQEILNDGESLFDSERRALRYVFIRENYDRKKVMMKAMKALRGLFSA